MRLVIIESPYAGNIGQNVAYARACVRDSLLRGEAPIASHLLYTQPGILRDDVPDERQHGIDAGLAWLSVADASVVYIDRGISKGMEYGIKAAEDAGLPVEYRSLLGNRTYRLLDPLPSDQDDLLRGMDIETGEEILVTGFRIGDGMSCDVPVKDTSLTVRSVVNFTIEKTNDIYFDFNRNSEHGC